MKYKKADILVPLDQCSKERNDDGISEYDEMVAVSRMPDEFTEEELDEEIYSIMIHNNLQTLVDKGFVEMSWDDNKSAIVYKATRLGEKYMKGKGLI